MPEGNEGGLGCLGVDSVCMPRLCEQEQQRAHPTTWDCISLQVASFRQHRCALCVRHVLQRRLSALQGAAAMLMLLLEGAYCASSAFVCNGDLQWPMAKAHEACDCMLVSKPCHMSHADVFETRPGLSAWSHGGWRCLPGKAALEECNGMGESHDYKLSRIRRMRLTLDGCNNTYVWGWAGAECAQRGHVALVQVEDQSSRAQGAIE
eukprot:1159016-Pelagomonas_calceolata.AAC.1